MKKIIRHILAAYGSGTPYHAGKWRIVEKAVRACGLHALDPVQEVTRQGVKWHLNTQGLVERSVFYLGVYEIHETRWLMQQIEPDWVVFDVGSNFGYYANLIARKVDADRAAVYAFEPSSAMYAALCRNKDLNEFAHLHPQHAAVAEQPGVLQLELPPEGNQGLGRLRERGEEQPNRRYEEVETVTLNAFTAANNVQRLDFIKIDVEGAETLVLAGGAEIIRRFKPKMMIEINPPSLEEFGTSAEALLTMIRELGYEIYYLQRGTLVPLKSADEVGDYVNAICVPSKGTEA